MYFANNEGLLNFDGTYWKLYPLPNKTIVRSIEFGLDKRIYIGGQDEIGYFSPNDKGKLAYTSLKSLIPEMDRSFADIWDIISYENDIFFRSNNKIFRLSQHKITVFDSKAAWAFMGISNNQLIAQEADRGILVFNQGKWEPLVPNNLLPTGLTVTSCTSFGKDSILLTTQKKRPVYFGRRKADQSEPVWIFN